MTSRMPSATTCLTLLPASNALVWTSRIRTMTTAASCSPATWRITGSLKPSSVGEIAGTCPGTVWGLCFKLATFGSCLPSITEGYCDMGHGRAAFDHHRCGVLRAEGSYRQHQQAYHYLAILDPRRASRPSPVSSQLASQPGEWRLSPRPSDAQASQLHGRGRSIKFLIR